MDVSSAKAIVRKVLWRVLPFVMLLLLFNLIDRTNISVAALQLNTDLGLTPTAYGLAAGIFFIGYFLFEIPSNLMLVRVGARPWLARIMISWGAIVICMAWMSGVRSFYALRFLLGVAEAGLLPGVLLYLSYWIPGARLGLAYSLLMATTAIANTVSGPIAAGLMQLDGAFGLRGWQLMFVAEGIPTIVVGLAVARYLPERPSGARWLSAEERKWLDMTIEREEQEKRLHGATSFAQGFFDRRVLLATLTCFLFVCCNFGTVFWLPQIIHSFGRLNTLQVGFLSSIPYLLGGAATILWGRHSDITGERKWHLLAGALLGAAGYISATLAHTAVGTLVALCVATIGIWSLFGVFWAYVGNFLGGAAAAGGFALVNSFGTLGGFVGPVTVGFIRERTHSFSGGLLALAGFALLTAITVLFIEAKATHAVARSAREATRDYV